MTPTTPRSSRARTADPATGDRPFRRRAVALLGALALAALGTGGLAAPADATPAQPAAPARPQRSGPDRPDAGPRSERHPVHPGHSRRRRSRPSSTRSRPGRSPTSSATERDALLFAPGHVRLRRQAADLPGRLLHRGRRPGPQPRRRRHQRFGRTCTTSASDADGCIALNNFWRSLSNLTINPTGGRGLPREHRVLGRLAGRADAPGRRHRHRRRSWTTARAGPSTRAAASSPTPGSAT